MPRLRYSDLPTLDHVAYVWAQRRRIAIGLDSPAGAQRALEIALDALPPSIRPATCDWALTRRNYCTRTGTADPRAARRQKGFWIQWLARRGLAVGDRLPPDQERELVGDLPEVAVPFFGLRTPPTQRIWRRRGWAGMNNTAKALVLTTLPSGHVLLDVMATRVREEMLQRGREKSLERYQAKSRRERENLIAAMKRRRQRARDRLQRRA